MDYAANDNQLDEQYTRGGDFWKPTFSSPDLVIYVGSTNIHDEGQQNFPLNACFSPADKTFLFLAAHSLTPGHDRFHRKVSSYAW
jgi:hypothetical protein